MKSRQQIIDDAAELMLAPLPKDGPERTQEINRRAELVARMLNGMERPWSEVSASRADIVAAVFVFGMALVGIAGLILREVLT